MTSAATNPPASERLHALDALRGSALLLGIVFHACMSFVPTRVPIFPVEDSHRGDAIAVLFFTTHVFRMTTFFLIAGFFAHMSFHRQGAAAFVRDRLKRIAIPLLVGWPILFASIVAVTIWAAAAGVGAASNGHPPAFPTFPSFPLTHLWFLYVLLEFYAAVLILRGVVATLDRTGRLRAGLDLAIAAVTNSGLAPFFLAAPVFAAFASDPKWLTWFGIPSARRLARHHPDGCDRLWRGVRLWLVAPSPDPSAADHRTALGAESRSRRRPDRRPSGLRRRRASPHPVRRPGHSSVCRRRLCRSRAGPRPSPPWAWRCASSPAYSPVRRYIADASYWLYLIHLPIVMALQVAVAGSIGPGRSSSSPSSP